MNATGCKISVKLSPRLVTRSDAVCHISTSDLAISSALSGFKEAIKMNYKENCFIFANTHGFHRRGNAKKNTIRESILLSVRENSFSI